MSGCRSSGPRFPAREIALPSGGPAPRTRPAGPLGLLDGCAPELERVDIAPRVGPNPAAAAASPFLVAGRRLVRRPGFGLNGRGFPVAFDIHVADH